MFGKCFQVKPCLLLHPIEWLCSVIDTATGFQKKTNIAVSKLTVFDKDLSSHHELKHDLVTFEETTIDVSVDLHSQAIYNVFYSLLSKLGFLRVDD